MAIANTATLIVVKKFDAWKFGILLFLARLRRIGKEIRLTARIHLFSDDMLKKVTSGDSEDPLQAIKSQRSLWTGRHLTNYLF